MLTQEEILDAVGKADAAWEQPQEPYDHVVNGMRFAMNRYQSVAAAAYAKALKAVASWLRSKPLPDMDACTEVYESEIVALESGLPPEPEGR